MCGFPELQIFITFSPLYNVDQSRNNAILCTQPIFSIFRMMNVLAQAQSAVLWVMVNATELVLRLKVILTSSFFLQCIIQEILQFAIFLDREFSMNWGNDQQILSMRISQLLIQEFIKHSSQWKVSLIAQKIVTIAIRERFFLKFPQLMNFKK